ncbi:MAG: lysophospholipid acyltransferase family protein [Clostridia bacterium]
MARTVNFLINMVERLPEKTQKSVILKILNLSIKYYADLDVKNKSNLKDRKGKPTIYIANHLSNMDGPVLNYLLMDYDVSFIAGVKLKNVKTTRLIMQALNTIEIKPGTPDMKAIKEAIKHLKDGGSLVIFPEGTRSRTAKMNQALKGFVLLAKMSGASIMPIGLAGTEKLLPINDDGMGKETLHKAEVKVSFGELFTLPKKKDVNVNDFNQYIADYCMIQIAKNLPKSYHGYYKGIKEEELLTHE